MGRVAIVWIVGMLVSGVGLAAPAGPFEVPPVSAEWAALGHAEAYTDSGDPARLTALVLRFEAANDAASLREVLSLRLARARAAAAFGGAPAVSALDEIRLDTMRRARAGDFKDLVVAALDPIDTERAEHLVALDWLRTQPSVSLPQTMAEVALSRWSKDPKARATARVVLAEEGRNRRVRWILEAGQGASSLLEGRLRRAVNTRDLEASYRAADALAAVDPLDVQAHIIRAYRADVAASTQPLPSRWDVLGTGWRDRGPRLSRLDRFVRETKAPPASARLALAWVLRMMGLFGDCHDALAPLASRHPNPDVHAARVGLEQLCAFDGSDAQSLTRWTEGQPFSMSVARAFVWYADGSGTAIQSQWARGAVQALLTRRLQVRSYDAMLWAVGAEALSPELRTLAAEQAEFSPALRARCLAQPSACQQQVQATATLAGSEDARMPLLKALEIAVARKDYRPDWARLSGQLGPETWREIGRNFTDYPADGSAPRFETALLLGLYAGRVDAVWGALNSAGPVLQPRALLRLRLAALALRDGPKQAKGSPVERWPALPFLGRSPVSTQTGEAMKSLNALLIAPNAVERFSGASTLLRYGHPKLALELAAPLLEQLPGAEIAVLRAHLGWRLTQVGDETGEGLVAQALRDAPGGYAPNLSQGLVFEASGRRDAAQTYFRRALRITPSSYAAVTGLLRTLPPEISPEALGRLLLTLAPVNHLARTAARAIEGGAAETLADHLRLARPMDEAGLAVCARGLCGSDRRDVALRWLVRQMDQASDTEALMAWAARGLDLVDRLESRGGDAGHWVRFLTKAVAAPSDVYGTYTVYWPTILATLRRAGEVSDEMAFRLWRNRGGWKKEAVGLMPPEPEEPESVWHNIRCRIFLDVDQDVDAVAPCQKAWAAGHRDRTLAGGVGYLVVVYPKEAAAAGLTPARVFESASAALAEGGDYLINKGLYAFGAGQRPAVGELFEAAWGRGFDLPGWDLSEATYAYFEPDIPLFMRRRIVRDREVPLGVRWLKLASAALASGQLASARRYLLAVEAMEAVRPSPKVDQPRLAELRDQVAVFEADVRAGRLNRRLLPAVGRAILSADAAAIERLSVEAPDADALAIARLRHLRQPAAVARATAGVLIARHPNRLLIYLAAITSAEAQGAIERARSLAHRAALAVSDDARLAQLDPLRHGPAHGLPDWLSTADAFEAWLGQPVDPAQSPAYQHSADGSVDLFVPTDWESDDESMIYRFGDGGVSVGVIPRGDRCTPARCLESRLAASAVHTAHHQVIWSATFQTLAGEVAFAVSRAAGAVHFDWVLARGLTVTHISARVPQAQLAGFKAGLHLVFATARPFDEVMVLSRAEALRDAVVLSESWAVSARDAQRRAPPGEGCPVTSVLRRSKTKRAGVLLDLYLSTPSVAARRRLTRCAGRGGGPLAVPALLEADEILHEIGRDFVARRPVEALATGLLLLKVGLTSAPPGEADIGLELAPFGLLEIVAALPLTERGVLVEGMLETGDAVLTGLLEALGSYVKLGLSDQRLLSLMASADESQRLIAINHIAHGVSEVVRQRARSILIEAVQASPMLRVLPGGLLVNLHRAGSQRDREAVTRAVEILKGRSDSQSRWMMRSILRYGIGSRPEHEERRLRTKAKLARWSLWALLPDIGWTYVRLDSPRRVFELAGQLADQLDTERDPTMALLRQGVSLLARGAGVALLAEDGGLDLDRPFECAERQRGFICSVFVRDPARVRTLLAKRALGKDTILVSGVEQVSELLESYQPRTGPRPDSGTQAPSAQERVRVELSVYGTAYRRGLILATYPDHLIRDTESLIFVEDRLFVVGGLDPRKVLLSQAAGGDAPRPRPLPDRLRASGPTFTGVKFPRLRVLERAPVLRATIKPRRIEFEADLPINLRQQLGVGLASPMVSGRILSGYLPEGASIRVAGSAGEVAAFLVSTGAQAGSETMTPSIERLLKMGADLLSEAKRAACALYPLSKDVAGAQWACALSGGFGFALSAGVVGFGAEGGVNAGLHFRWADGVLQLGTAPTLIERDPHAVDGETQFRLAFDGRAVAELLPKLAVNLDPSQQMGMRAVSAMAGAFKRLEMDARPVGRRLRIEGTAELMLRAPGVVVPETRAGWLAVGNSLKLPRFVRASEQARALQFVFRQPAGPNGPFGAHPRLKVSKGAEDQLLVRVDPASAQVERRALTEAERARWTAKVEGSDAAAVRRLAATVKGAAADQSPQALARATVRWVQENLRYEVTPNQISLSQITTTNTGDCSEFADLTVAVLRELGVPAALEEGLLLDGDSLVAHAWVQFHDGVGVREIDPTNDRMRVDAGFIPVDILSLILEAGQGLEVVSVEAAEP